MSDSEQVRTATRRARSTTAVLVLAVAVILGAVLAGRTAASPSLAAFRDVPTQDGGGDRQAAGTRSGTRQAPDLPRRPGGAGPAVPAGVTVDDGVVPDGVTVFDVEVPGVANVDPDLLSTLRQAATAAAGDGVEFLVNSGWRSPAYQDELRREAVAEYGSEAEAARWVAPADTSAHVTGDAMDLGSDAAAWLSDHGAEYGLCQTYGNEPWHYELRPEAVDSGCPTPYADPTDDPRMRQ